MRNKIIAEIERRISKLDNRHGLCLHYARHTLDVLKEFGYNAVIQAGSLQWPRIRRKEDDGVCNTHFSYMWSPETVQSLASMLVGNLPEMHCWVGILDTQEIVDFTTRHLKDAAVHLGPWTAENPPKFLWCRANQTPDWVIYRPNRDASILAHILLQHLERFENEQVAL